jgi:hypothetical protein
MKRGTVGDIVLEGEVRFAGERIDALPAHEIRMRGLVHCPERRRPFRELTVLENLLAGAFLSKNKHETQRRLEHCFALFPRLSERKGQIAGTLSGGEQQMLATAADVRREAADRRAPLGLAPRIRQELFAAIGKIHAEGVPVPNGGAGGRPGIQEADGTTCCPRRIIAQARRNRDGRRDARRLACRRRAPGGCERKRAPSAGGFMANGMPANWCCRSDAFGVR